MQNGIETLVELGVKQRGHPFEQSGVNFERYPESGLDRQAAI